MKVTDTSKIISMAGSIIALFGFNNLKANKLNLYVKDNMYRWVAERKEESEIETLIKSKAEEVDRNN